MRYISAFPVVVFLWVCLLALWPQEAVRAQTAKPRWLWAQSGGGASLPRREMGKRIEVDASGNSYVVGNYIDSARFGNVVLREGLLNGTSSFIAKYAPSGALLWIYGSRWLRIYDLALDPAGDCYALVTGDTLAGTVLPSRSTLSLVRFGLNGQVGWRHTVSPHLDASDARLAIDRRGRYYVAGSYSRATVIGPDTLPAPPGQIPNDTTSMTRRAFIACFNPAWALQWIVSSDGAIQTQHVMGALQVDAAGNAIAAINFQGTFTLGTTTLVNTSTSTTGNFEQAIVKVTSGGQFVWARHVVRNSDGAALTGLAVDSAGNSYVAGTYRGLALFGSITQFSSRPDVFNYYLVKYDPVGQQQWMRDLRVRTQQVGLAARGGVAVDRAGYPYQIGEIVGEVLFGSDTLGADPLQGGDIGRAFVLKYTPTGQAVWGLNIGAANVEEMMGGLAFDAQSQGYLTGGFTSILRLGPAQIGSSGGSDVFVAKMSRDALGPGPVYHFYDLGGRVFVDADSNGTWGAGETHSWAPVVVEVQPGPFYLTAIDGQFYNSVPAGSYTLTVPHAPRYYSVTTPPHTATFTTPGQVDTTNHFGVYVQPITDLAVTLTAASLFRPARPSHYVLTCRNVGTVPQDGTVTLTLDPRLTFVGSQPTPPVAIAGNTFTWNVAPLLPQQQVSWIIRVRPDTAVAIGTVLTSVGQVMLPPDYVDAYPADNIDTSTVAVRNSHDPNDKLVSHAQLSPQQVLAGPWLTYTVRFQNTGNAPALRVRILDTLSATLQRASIEVLAASHPFTWQLKGVGVAEFIFRDINLPDSTTNEPESHGFVRYRVRVRPTLVVGDSVPNTARIYFDYNEAIVTNTAVTRVQLPKGSPGISEPVNLYPNPARESVRLLLTAPVAGQLVVRVLNALGQLVWQETSVVAAGPVSRIVPVRGWAPGLYHVQVQCGARVSAQRLVVTP